MNKILQNRQPWLFMGAAVVISLLSYLLLFRGVPEPTRQTVEVKRGAPEFKAQLHLTNIKADSFAVLLHQVYSTAKVERSDNKIRVTISGQGARASDFYNDNPDLLKVKSDEFSVVHNKSKDEIAAIFTLHTEGKEAFIRLPNDILFQLTEKAANAKHG